MDPMGSWCGHVNPQVSRFLLAQASLLPYRGCLKMRKPEHNIDHVCLWKIQQQPPHSISDEVSSGSQYAVNILLGSQECVAPWGMPFGILLGNIKPCCSAPDFFSHGESWGFFVMVSCPNNSGWLTSWKIPWTWWFFFCDYSQWFGACLKLGGAPSSRVALFHGTSEHGKMDDNFEVVALWLRKAPDATHSAVPAWWPSPSITWVSQPPATTNHDFLGMISRDLKGWISHPGPRNSSLKL